MTLVLTKTEENYLKAIYKANERSKNAVNTNTVAAHMNTSAASVTDMLKKLAQKDLVLYEKYKGAKLSPEGTRLATAVIRRHRLWETFLVDKLGFSWEEVHDIAEELEHIKSDKLVAKLDSFLGYPKYDPHGDPIPNAEGKFTLRDQMICAALEIGDEGVMVGVKNHTKSFLDYLNQCNINIGSTIKVIDRISFDKSMKVVVGEHEPITLSIQVTQNLLIRKI